MKSNAWIIAKPSRGKYTADCLRWEEREVGDVPEGTVLVKTELLSIDPTTRNWLLLDPEKMMIPLQVGDVMIGVNVGRVVESRAEGFAAGDLVSGIWGWEDYALAQPMLIEKHDDDGACGSIAAQLAKATGARVIGLAGGAEKVAYLTEELGLDGAVDHRAEDRADQLRALAPEGYTVFFDNVGGAQLDEALTLMAPYGRVVICGSLADYGRPADELHAFRNIPELLKRNVSMRPFWMSDHNDKIPEYFGEFAARLADGSLRIRPAHVVPGIDRVAEGLSMLLAGANSGKLVVQLSDS